MALRPNFAQVVRLDGESMTVSGESNNQPNPLKLEVFLEQDGNVVGETVHRFADTWDVFLPSEDFHPGPALAFGVEIRINPFSATSWTEMVTIE